MFSKNWLCLFLLYCFQSLINWWHERRYCTCNVSITNTQILFTRGSVRVRKLGRQSDRATKAQKTSRHVRGNAPRNILRSRVPEIPFSAFWGVIWHNYEMSYIYIIHNLERTGEDESPPPSPLWHRYSPLLLKFYILSHKHY